MQQREQTNGRSVQPRGWLPNQERVEPPGAEEQTLQGSLVQSSKLSHRVRTSSGQTVLEGLQRLLGGWGQDACALNAHPAGCCGF